MMRRAPSAPDRPAVSDHALVRLLQRSGMDVEAVRVAMEQALENAHRAANQLGGGDHLIVLDGLTYVVRDRVVTTVVEARRSEARASLMRDDTA